MVRHILLALLMASAFISNAQQNFSNPAYTYIYKLDSASANLAYTKGLRDTVCFFNNKVDSFLDGRPKLVPGTYVVARAIGQTIRYSLLSIPFATIDVLSFNQVVQVRFYDTLYNNMKDVLLVVDDELIEFDTTCNCFLLEPSRNVRSFYARYKNDFVFGRLDPERDKQANYNYNNNSYSPPVISHGYFIVNQPKYLPGDTVKLKAYILKPNGKAIKKPLNLYLSDKRTNYRVLLGAIEPVTPGAFIYQFRIPDSLKIDRDYSLDFYKKGGEFLQGTTFRIEEYKLRNSTYEARIEKKTIYNGERVKFYAKATDANDLPIYDAKVRVRIRLNAFGNFGGKFLFVPDTWKE